MGRLAISSRAAHLVVAGAGVIGSSVAWRAAQAGLRVTLVDPSPLPSRPEAASWAAAGMLTPVSEAHYGEETLLRLNLASAERFGPFVEELREVSDIDVGYRACGTIVVARDNDDNLALDDLFAFYGRLGLAADRLRAEECRELEPRLSPRVRGGIHVAGDHQVDNRALMTALQEACTKEGVYIVRGRVTSLESNNDRVEGVTVDGAVIACDAVVLAAGAWCPDIEGIPEGALPPLRPVKGQLLQLKGASLMRRNIRGLDVYMVPRADGRLAVGATMEELGFDARPTAEAAYELLRDAFELVPGVLELELVEQVVGFRPATPDNAPVIGRTNFDGLLLATGHFRNGVLLAPITADAIVAELTGGSLAEAEPFSPARFARSKVAT